MSLYCYNLVSLFRMHKIGRVYASDEQHLALGRYPRVVGKDKQQFLSFMLQRRITAKVMWRPKFMFSPMRMQLFHSSFVHVPGSLCCLPH